MKLIKSPTHGVRRDSLSMVFNKHGVHKHGVHKHGAHKHGAELTKVPYAWFLSMVFTKAQRVWCPSRFKEHGVKNHGVHT